MYWYCIEVHTQANISDFSSVECTGAVLMPQFLSLQWNLTFIFASVARCSGFAGHGARSCYSPWLYSVLLLIGAFWYRHNVAFSTHVKQIDILLRKALSSIHDTRIVSTASASCSVGIEEGLALFFFAAGNFNFFMFDEVKATDAPCYVWMLALLPKISEL